MRTAGAEGITCIGIRRGYAGLINGDVFELTGNDVDGIARRGGTILYTARSEEFRTEAGVDKAAKVCKYLGIDGLITIGGDGTLPRRAGAGLPGCPRRGYPRDDR